MAAVKACSVSYHLKYTDTSHLLDFSLLDLIVSIQNQIV